MWIVDADQDGGAPAGAEALGEARMADLFAAVLGEMLSETLDLMDDLDRWSAQLPPPYGRTADDEPIDACGPRAATLRLASRLATVGGWILASQRDRSRSVQERPATGAASTDQLDLALSVDMPSAMMLRRSDLLTRAADGPLDGVAVPADLRGLAARIDALVARAGRIDAMLRAPKTDASPTTGLAAAISA